MNMKEIVDSRLEFADCLDSFWGDLVRVCEWRREAVRQLSEIIPPDYQCRSPLQTGLRYP